LAAIWAGAVGNGIDRALHGQVTDFFLFFRESWNFYFPAFNVADAGISAGVGLILLDEWLTWRATAREALSGKKEDPSGGSAGHGD